MKEEALLYIKPVMTLGTMPERFIRITPEQAKMEAKKFIYMGNDIYKGFYTIKVNHPEGIVYVGIFIEHPHIQKLNARDVYSKFTEWLDHAMYQAGYGAEAFTKEVYKIMIH